MAEHNVAQGPDFAELGDFHLIAVRCDGLRFGQVIQDITLQSRINKIGNFFVRAPEHDHLVKPHGFYLGGGKI